MPWDNTKARVAAVAAIVLLAAVVVVFLIPRINPPTPQRHTFHIFPGGVSHVSIKDSYQKTSRPGTFTLPILPHHLEYESSRGDVSIYIVKAKGRPEEQIREMMRLGDKLRAGHAPDSCVAQSSGKSGQVSLHSWPYGTAHYLMFVHSAEESDVSITIYYGP